VSHHADGITGLLGESSLGLALIGLIALLPIRPGAVPAFYPEPGLSQHRRRLLAR
jgi:hypothetical protein